MLRVCFHRLFHLINAYKYSFGAVLEEFEVRDALESVFYAKAVVNDHS